MNCYEVNGDNKSSVMLVEVKEEDGIDSEYGQTGGPTNRLTDTFFMDMCGRI